MEIHIQRNPVSIEELVDDMFVFTPHARRFVEDAGRIGCVTERVNDHMIVTLSIHNNVARVATYYLDHRETDFVRQYTLI